jgi:hypothetical protein
MNEAVRAASDREAAIRADIDSIYAQCFAAAGWDRRIHLRSAEAPSLSGFFSGC